MDPAGLNPRVRVVADPPELAAAAAAQLIEWLQADLRGRERVSLGLSGGHTPGPVYARMASEPLRGRVDWRRVDFFFGDERAVPVDHPQSNYRMASESLFDPLGIDPAQIHRMPTERPDAPEVYAAALPEALDVLLLGMGPDGHTASLFPGDAAVAELRRQVMRVWASKPPAERLTLGPAVLAAARQVLVLVSGADKAAALARALAGPWDPLQTPVQLARERDWIVDRPAAGLLPIRNT